MMAAVVMATGGQSTFAVQGGAGVYALPAWRGYIDLRSCLVLEAGSWQGIQFTSRWIGKMPDSLYAKVYIALLCAVLLVMVVA